MNHSLKPLKAALWIYFWLLLFEGALRKWILPQYSDVLFIIRDPVVMVIYLLAWQARVFPLRPAVLVLGAYAVVSLAFALQNDVPITVTIFGLRTDFLHLPLVFVMGAALNREDVLRYGRWTMLAAIPILVLMWLQFRSGPNAWVNYGANGVAGAQLRGAMGHIRPPGPFSFITGVVAFFALVAAFVFHGWFQRGAYPRWLLWTVTIVTVLAVPISISRSLLLAVLVVAAFGLVIAARDLRRVPAYIGPLVAALAVLALSSDSIMVQVFRTRWEESIEAGSGGFRTNVVMRLVDGFLEPFELATTTPLIGHGIGMGTVAGARMMTGKFDFLLSESELSRIVLELGPILGFAFIGWRFWLALLLVLRSWQAVRITGSGLAWLLTGACFLNIISWQWGPATNLGFAVFGAGLAYAAVNPTEEDELVPMDLTTTTDSA